jgi:hypothetical protein
MAAPRVDAAMVHGVLGGNRFASGSGMDRAYECRARLLIVIIGAFAALREDQWCFKKSVVPAVSGGNDEPDLSMRKSR